MGSLRCGFHKGIDNSLNNAILSAISLEAKCVQFSFDDYGYSPPNGDPISTSDIKQLCDRSDISVYIKSPLNINLDTISARSCQSLKNNLELVSNLPASVVLTVGVVGTVGPLISQLDGLVSERRTSLDPGMGSLRRCPYPLLLEPSMRSNWDQLRKVFESVDSPGKIGISVDKTNLILSRMWMEQEEFIDLFDKCQEITGDIPRLVHIRNPSYSPSLHNLVSTCISSDVDIIIDGNNPIAGYYLVRESLGANRG